MDSPTGTKPWSRGSPRGKKIDNVTVNDIKKPVPYMINKRVVNMSGVKKDQGEVEEEREADRG